MVGFIIYPEKLAVSVVLSVLYLGTYLNIIVTSTVQQLVVYDDGEH